MPVHGPGFHRPAADYHAAADRARQAIRPAAESSSDHQSATPARTAFRVQAELPLRTAAEYRAEARRQAAESHARRAAAAPPAAAQADATGPAAQSGAPGSPPTPAGP